MRIALIGYKGFVGETLFLILTKMGHDVVGVSREEYEVFKSEKFDIVINSAMPSKRYWAYQNPMADFDATVRLTADIVYNWKTDKIVLISTVSARCQLDHPYGLNKLIAETLVLNRSARNLVIRLGGLYGEKLDKGAVYDIMMRKEVFSSAESRYNYISVENASKIIADKLDRSGIIEVGARDQISLGEIANHLGYSIKFSGKPESQATENPDKEYPSACQVLKFVDMMVKKR
jgi:nucleoside-diphosphate-sugar epimerase